MNRNFSLCLVIAFAITALLAFGDLCAKDLSGCLSGDERDLLNQMLVSAELDSTSIAFEKDWDLSTKYKLDSQLSELQNPWLAFERLDSLRSLLKPLELSYPHPQMHAELSQMARGSYKWDPSMEHEWSHLLNLDWFATIEGPMKLLYFAAHVYAELDGQFREIVGRNSAVPDSLSSFFFHAFSEAQDSLALATLLQSRGLPTEIPGEAKHWSPHLDGLDQEGLQVLERKFLIFAAFLRDKAAQSAARMHSAQSLETPYGIMMIGGRGDDRYTAETLQGKRLALLIEPAGNDIYSMPLYTDYQQPYYLLIDLEGDDLYRNAGIAEQFSVNYGFGISYDLRGNDTYRTGDYSFSAAYGSMLHVDMGGNDIYESGLFSQGAAMFGTALLVDCAGDDLYSASTMAQGFGSTKGLGAVLDLEGSDRYLLGLKYTHAPLMPNDYRSMGQGMGFGFRPDCAGGIGLIYDGKGNDKYIGGIYAQGVGYWYATGILIDEEGNDVYNAVYYPQGSGIHLANGYLYDGGGDDAYYTRNGPGQGAGHDWALGILLDKSGDDAYSIPGGNGLGLNNSVGIFVDSRGNDRYERKVSNAYGFANLGRRSGGIGLFLDTSGTDSYPDSLFADNRKWIRGTYGIGWDTELYEAETDAPAPDIESDPVVDSLATIEEVFAAASEWEVGSAVQRVRSARELLKSRADEAIAYIEENKLDSQSGLEYRALEELVLASEVFRERLYLHLEDADSLKAKNSLALISATGDSMLIDQVRSFLARSKYTTACLGALGGIKTDTSVDLLSEWISSPVERYRYIAARSLLAIDSERSRALLRSLCGDRSFLIQSMVRSLGED